MFGEHHYLASDLPEYKTKIHHLKLEDTHFSKLYSEYVDLDKSIYRIEEGIEVTSDEYLCMLKTQRVILKDELYDLLKRLERSRAGVINMEKMNKLLMRQRDLVARLESIEADCHCGLNANSDAHARIASAATEELAKIEMKLAEFA